MQFIGVSQQAEGGTNEAVMSWKPCRSSGIMFDRFTSKSNKHRDEYLKMLQSNTYLKFENLNRFSKHFYLYWLNENKKHFALVGKNFDKLNPFRSIEIVAFPSLLPMFERNIDKIYKPLALLLLERRKGGCECSE